MPRYAIINARNAKQNKKETRVNTELLGRDARRKWGIRVSFFHSQHILLSNPPHV